MGLDIVELVLAIEDGFQIHIADEEASNAATVGELYDLVISKLELQDSRRCLTSTAFYRTRRALVETLGVKRREVKPSTPLEVILPRKGRREQWRRIQDRIKLRVPDLQHSGKSLAALLFIGIMLTVGPGLYGSVGFAWLMPLLLLGLAAGGFLVKLSPSLATAFPQAGATVGDLAKNVLAMNHAALAAEVGGWNREEV
jgi:hypothetical protein